MKLYTKEKSYELYNGDILDMKEVIKDNSIDSIVCDPPYGLTSITKRFGKEGSAVAQYGKDGSFSRLSKGFMNESWDGSGIEYNVEAWRKCYDVLKPGGYLLAFGGTKTYHRVACAIEDAGFEIRDCIMYLYGSGFPKSMNIGKAIEAKEKFGNAGTRNKRKVEQEKGTGEKIVKQPNNGMMGEIKEVIRKDYESKNEFAGYGTCLKPAYEPIIMARKPLEGTVASNCLKYGVGALNIDECRVGNDTNSYKEHTGRFPANVITDGSEEVASGMPESAGSKGVPFNKNDYGEHETATCFTRGNYNPYNDSGSAMRYYYAAKASKKDRNDGLSESERNIHPTVKPTELMQYLVRLVSPSGATILDPFMGSGSTGKAIMFENRERNVDYKFIGIDLTDKYLPIAKARIDYALNQYEYDAKEKEIKTGQMSLFDYKEQ